MIRTKLKINPLPDDTFQVKTFADYVKAVNLNIQDFVIVDNTLRSLFNDPD